MTGIHISQVAIFGCDQRGDQRDEPVRAERRQARPDALHDGQRLEPVDVRRMERALHDAGQHRRRDAVPRDVGDEQCGLSRSSPRRSRRGRRRAPNTACSGSRPPAGSRSLRAPATGSAERPALPPSRSPAAAGAAMFLTPPAQLDAALHERLEHLAIERLLDEVEGRAADAPAPVSRRGRRRCPSSG